MVRYSCVMFLSPVPCLVRCRSEREHGNVTIISFKINFKRSLKKGNFTASFSDLSINSLAEIKIVFQK